MGILVNLTIRYPVFNWFLLEINCLTSIVYNFIHPQPMWSSGSDFESQQCLTSGNLHLVEFR